jgi:predicted nucleic acid-binding protein
VIVLDTSGLLAAYGQDLTGHAPVTEILRADPGPLILSPFVLAELDYLVTTRAGVAAELTVLRDVAAGVYRLADFSSPDVTDAAGVTERYAGLKLGLADASVVVLAARFGTSRVLTFDHRHFRALTPLQGGSFTLLPADDDQPRA